MKKFCFLTLMGLLSVGFKGFLTAEMNQTKCIYGHHCFGKETVQSIQAAGSVVLEKTQVLNLVEVNGSLEADQAIMGGLQVNGQVDLKNCSIDNDSYINGTLTADHTHFQKGLSIAAQKIALKTCTLDSLTVREVKGFHGVQVVDLRYGTKVTGPITIESGHGEVWLSSNSEVLGLISGAKVYKK